MRLTLGFVTFALLAACSAPSEAPEHMATTQQRIQGGDPEKGLPNIGMLEFSTGNFGTATLITPRVVVTAGHVVGGNIQGFYVGAGKPILRGPDFSVSSEMKKYGIKEKLTHPSYQCTQDCAKFNGMDLDMGIVLLDSPASEYVPLALGGGSLTSGMGCTTTGYGDHVVDWDASDASPFVKEKRTASVKLLTMDAATLQVQWVTGISDHGDSGGPLFCNGALVGTTAYHTDGDDESHRNEFCVRLDAAMPWVKEQLKAWGDLTLEAAAASDAGVDDAAAPAPTPLNDEPATAADSSGGCSASASSADGWAALATLALVFGLGAARRRLTGRGASKAS